MHEAQRHERAMVTKALRQFAFVLTVSIGAGCATSEVNRFHPATEIPSGKAVVHVYRVWNMVGGLEGVFIFENNQQVSFLRSGKFYSEIVDPGHRTYDVRLTAAERPVFKLDLDIEAGETYYLEYFLTGGLKRVDAQRGEERIRRCHHEEFAPPPLEANEYKRAPVTREASR